MFFQLQLELLLLLQIQILLLAVCYVYIKKISNSTQSQKESIRRNKSVSFHGTVKASYKISQGTEKSAKAYKTRFEMRKCIESNQGVQVTTSAIAKMAGPMISGRSTFSFGPYSNCIQMKLKTNSNKRVFSN
jgi:hypothetical protein